MAKIKNLGDEFSEKMTLRLSRLQYDHVVDMATAMTMTGKKITPSAYIRMLIDASLAAVSNGADIIQDKEGEFVNGDDIQYFDDKL